MSSGAGKIRRIASAIAQPSSTIETFVCSSCRSRQSPSRITSSLSKPSIRRNYAAAASAPAPLTESSTSQLTPPTESTNSQPQYTVRAGVLLSRAPLLTAAPTPFEKAFFFYQRRLNERLVLPFSQYFYFKRGTPAYEEWKVRRRERAGTATRDIGSYSAYGKEAWNDEILMGDKSSEPESIVKTLIEEEGREKFPTSEEIADANKPLHGLRRTTEADRKNDTRSLERALSRTLYLLVKSQKPGKPKGEGYWHLPSGDVEGTEGLREAAQRTLEASCGPNMNTWFVANHPVGHHVFSRRPTTPDQQFSTSSSTPSESSSSSSKTFFLKSRIMAGQVAIPEPNTLNIMDYQWLAKDEVEKVVAPGYWRQIKGMLAER